LLAIRPQKNTKYWRQAAIGLWSNRNEPLALLISGPYAAGTVEMRRESREVVPAMVFTRSEIYIFEWSDLAQMHRPEDGAAKKE
jgi:hypothetical protein